MGKELITGLVAGGGRLEWTTLARDKGRLAVAVFRRVEAEPAAEGAPGGDGPAAGLASRLRAVAGSIKGTVTVCLPADRLLMRTVEIPAAVPLEEVAGMVGLQMDKISPFPVEDMVFSHEILSESETGRRVLIAAVRADAADVLEKELHGGGLAPVRLDVSSLGWWSLIRESGKISTEGRQVAVVLSGGLTELIVATGGVPALILSMEGPPLDGAGGGWERDVADEVAHTLLAMELEHGLAGAVSVSIWKPAEVAGGLAGALEEACRCGTTVHALDELPPLSEGVARRSAEPGSGRLDLTPPAWRADQKTRAFRKKLLTVGEILLGIWVVAIGGVLGGTYAMEWSVARLRVRQEEWKQPANEVRDLRARVRLIQKYTEFSHTAIECMREAAALKPEGVKMNSFDYKRGERLKLLGQGDTVNQVYDFKNRLDGSALFKGLDVSLAMGPQFDKRTNKQIFEIDIKLPGGEP